MTSNPPLPEKPFFIVGPPRSGTTLLRFILSSHPRLYVPAETGFLPFLNINPDAVLTVLQLGRLLEKIGRLNTEWANLVEDIPTFSESLPSPRLPHVLDALYRKMIAPQGAHRWGDKTPSYVRYLPAIQNIFSEAQFIHLIRDGRDATLSAREKWSAYQRVYMTDIYLLMQWVQNVQAGQAFGRKQNNRTYYEIRYENLVLDPESTLKDLCDFLGESFHPAMLDHTALATQVIQADGHLEVTQPIRTTSLGRWKVEMDPFRKKLADHVAGPTLQLLGYPLADQDPFSFLERVRKNLFAVHYYLIDVLRRSLINTGWLKPNRGKRKKAKR